MKITIIGASGTVGSCAAFTIAINKLADELVMIDTPRQDMLHQYVTDLSTAVTGLDMLVRAGSEEDMRHSDIIIIAAGSAQIVSSRLEVLPRNLPIIKDIAMKIKQFCAGAVVITATNPVCPLNYAVHLCLKSDRKKIIGYSSNDSVRFRMILAEAIGVGSSQVEGTVIGEHGNSQVLLFSSVKVKGKPVSLSEDIKQKVQLQVANIPKTLESQRIQTGRTAGWTTSLGLASTCRAIGKNTGEMIPGSAVLDGEYGYHGLSMTVPAILGKGGIREIREWVLPPDEREKLNQSVNTLRPAMEYVEEFLGTG